MFQADALWVKGTMYSFCLCQEGSQSGRQVKCCFVRLCSAFPLWSRLERPSYLECVRASSTLFNSVAQTSGKQRATAV